MNDSQKLAIRKCIDTLVACQVNEDTEEAHSDADEALCELLASLGLDIVVGEYNKIEKWYA